MAKLIRNLVALLIALVVIFMFATGRFSWKDFKYETRRAVYKAKSLVTDATGGLPAPDSHAAAAICRENLRLLERAKRKVADEQHMAVGFVTVQQVASALGGELPVCPAGGTYTLNELVQLPTCSIGAGSNGLSKKDDHLITNY